MKSKNLWLWIIGILAVVYVSFASSSDSNIEKKEYNTPQIKNRIIHEEAKLEEDTLLVKEIPCDLGKCGIKNLTEEMCNTVVCCKIGEKYSVKDNIRICEAEQNRYMEAQEPLYIAPTTTKPTTQTRTSTYSPKTTCCKVCSKGKACGNSCISRDKTCHQPPGCACNR